MRNSLISQTQRGKKESVPKAIFVNLNGLYTRNRKDKPRQLSEIAEEENVIIIAVAETHLREEVQSREVHVKGFRLNRMDRANEVKKGGVALYIREDLSHMFGDVQGASVSNTEFLCMASTKMNLVVCVLYRPDGEEGLTAAIEAIKSYVHERAPPLPNIIIMGDFNFPQIDWKTGIITGAHRSGTEKRAAHALCEFAEDLCLLQVIDKPTRAQNILDLVFTNNEEIIHSWRVADTDLGDHRMITVSILLPSVESQRCPDRGNRFSRLNFYSPKVNWQALSTDISHVEWANAPSDSLDVFYEFILENLWECCRRWVPPRRKPAANRIPRDRKILMRKRRRLQLQQATADGVRSDIVKARIDAINKQLKLSVDAELEAEEKKAVQVVKVNPKYFFAYANNRRCASQYIGPLIKNGEMVTDCADMADALQDQYIDACSRPLIPDVANAIGEWAGPDREDTIDQVVLNRSNLREAMAKLSERSSAGPDGVPSILLKRCSEALLSPLHSLWTLSVETGNVPTKFKEGIVTPLFKGGDRGDCKNYRPIVLTSHICKVFERVIADQLVEYLEKGGFLSRNQHGFRKGRSCSSQLLQHQHTILRSLESGSEVDVIYLDFSKAFDKVDLGVLLLKLRALGVKNDLLAWLHSFLVDRRQKVVIVGCSSRWGEVVCGVPQGTVLGPILFLAHITDIDVGATSTISSFADDTRVMRDIRGSDDAALLQLDLDKIYRWASSNNMSFNDDKFRALHYNVGGSTLHQRSYCAPGGKVIEVVEDVKDLGVVMSCDGKFTRHIETSVRKARKMMGWVLRTFATRDPDPMLILYKAIVLPHLEYCCQVWNPVTLGGDQEA